MRVAIIGAGVSGMSCAHTLIKRGASVEIFEKRAGVGGRIATNDTERIENSVSFDNGAQYFTVSSPEFKEYVEHWINDGIAALWDGKIGKIVSGELLPEANAHERFVGVPTMNSIAKHMAKNLNINFDKQVEGVKQSGSRWSLQFKDDDENSDFDAVVVCAPPPEAKHIVRDILALKEQCENVTMNPCWSTMVEFRSRLDLEFDGIFGEKTSALSWMCRDSSKPERADGERFVLHATPEWTRKHLNHNADAVSSLLLKEFFEMTETPVTESSFSESYLWLNAAPAELKTFAGFCDESGKLRMCGDWCHSGKVEGAFLSGLEAAESLLLL